jgi:hypothetical protein
MAARQGTDYWQEQVEGWRHTASPVIQANLASSSTLEHAIPKCYCPLVRQEIHWWRAAYGLILEPWQSQGQTRRKSGTQNHGPNTPAT